MEAPFDLDEEPKSPFRPADLTIEFVSAVAGKRKTLTSLIVSLDRAKQGRKTIFAMPTLELIREMMEFARQHDPTVSIHEITGSPGRTTVAKRIRTFIEKNAANPTGLLLFISHEGFHRVSTWPEGTERFDLIIDEEPGIVLTREPFQLRYSHWVLTNFLNVTAVPTTLAERLTNAPPQFTANDAKNLAVYERICQPDSGSAPNEKNMAARAGRKLLTKRDAWNEWLTDSANRNRENAKTYYLITAREDFTQEDPQRWLKLRQDGIEVDDIYKYLDPIPRWLIQEAALFTEMAPWNAMVVGVNRKSEEAAIYNRGLVTIIGFRRPDTLAAFRKVTIMSALFEHTMLYMVWKQLGVRFVPSREIDITDQTTHLGRRKLNIYWLYDEGWSKRVRDASGGIENVLELIRKSGVINEKAEVCVVVNKDDGGPDNPTVVRKVFPKAIVMPHNSRGQNRFRHHHQLMHLAALNAYTRDIRWLESVLGIDADKQRIARTGQEIYQTAMRTSLREPNSRHDVDIIVVDKAVAEWLVQWFEPTDQVSVFEIDSKGVINRKKKPGPKTTTLGRPLTQVERNRRYREKKRMENAD